MLSMAEKTLVGLVVTLAVVFTAIFVLPVWTYEARLSTSPSSSNISVPRGQPFNVTCQGESNLIGVFKNMRWLNPKGNEISQGVQKVGENSLVLAFTDPKEDDSGIYKCLALYENKRMEIHVSINFYGPRPEFETTYEKVEAEEGNSVEMHCSATGDNPMAHEWLDQNEDKISPNPSLNSSIHIATSETGTVLIIDQVRLDQGGVYTCTVSNLHGMSSKLFELTVVPVDSNGTALLRKVETKQITATSVQLSISVSEQVYAIDVKYEESRDSAAKYTTFRKSAIYEVNGLIPGGKYSFQFKPVTIYNVSSDWSDAYHVTLLPPKPEVIFRNLQGDTLKIEWTRTIDDIMRESTDKFQLRYYTLQMEGGSSWNASSCAITIELPSCRGSSYTIAGLSKNVYYEIQLRAHTVSGFGEAHTSKFFLS